MVLTTCPAAALGLSLACKHIPPLLPQSLANLLWGYCKLDVYPEELFKAAAAELVERWVGRGGRVGRVAQLCFDAAWLTQHVG